MAATSEMGTPGERIDQKEPMSSSEVRARKRPIVDDDVQDKKKIASKIKTNLIPLIPDIGQYEVSFFHAGESNYRRQYRVFTTNSENIYRQDYTSEIFFKTPPDIAGNMCSPVATVFQSASFISALEELALQAEVVRARQMLVTQPIAKQQGNMNLDPSNLFFDSESRAVQSSATAEDDASQAQSLAMQSRLMSIINRLQTTDPNTGRERTGVGTTTTAHIPPPIPPQLFAAPDKQQVVPGVRPPEARSDLVDLMRVVNDHIAAAMGVPASVIFEGTLLLLRILTLLDLQTCARVGRQVQLKLNEPTPTVRHFDSDTQSPDALTFCLCAQPQHDRHFDSARCEQGVDRQLPRLLLGRDRRRRVGAIDGSFGGNERGSGALREWPHRHRECPACSAAQLGQLGGRDRRRSQTTPRCRPVWYGQQDYGSPDVSTAGRRRCCS